VEKLYWAIGILLVSNIAAWWQLNGQFYFKDHWFWNNPYWMAIILGTPIGLCSGMLPDFLMNILVSHGTLD